MATDVKARLTNTGFSAQKVRLVIDMVRGKSVADALNILKFSNRVCAEPLYKLRLFDCFRSSERRRKLRSGPE